MADGGQSRFAVNSGCPHRPHTVFFALTNEAMCRACADGKGVEGEYLSTYAYEAESLMEELDARRNRALQVLRSCPSMLDLERMRDRAKQDVDLFLLEIVKAVDEHRTRLHRDIDAAIAERVDTTTATLLLARRLEAIKIHCDGLGVGSDATGDAVVALRMLKHAAPELNEISNRTSTLAQPFELRLRSELSKLDLASLSITTLPRGAPSSASPAA